MRYELIIIGAGPAGLTAAIYAGRARVKTLVIEKGFPGGELGLYSDLENYPGFPDGVDARELASQMHKQAEKFGALFSTEEALVLDVGKKEFTIKTNKETHQALAVIIATGASPLKLGIPGEKELTGRGVSYCATCDGPLYRNKTVAMVGGGNSALEEALFLTKFASKVYLIHRRDRFRGDVVLQEQIAENNKIETIMSTTISQIIGEDRLKAITINEGKGARELPLDGLFIMVGKGPATDFLGKLVKRDKYKYIIADQKCETSKKGIFAAGDCRQKHLRQVIVACGDGALAFDSAKHYIEALKGVSYPSRDEDLSIE